MTMLKSHRFVIILFMLVIFMALTGCASGPVSTPAPTATLQPTPTLSPEAIQEAMFKAVKSDDIEALRSYIAAGADANGKADFGLTALDIAIARKNDEMALLLIDTGAVWTTKTFHSAVSYGDLEVVRYFLDHGADINERSGSYGFHALLHAAWDGQVEVGKLLLERGADVYLGDNWNDPAMNIAAYRGHLAFVEMLLSRGVNPNTPNENGKTALDHSISQNHPEVEKVLRETGAFEEK
jgi:ankyrin repeat protein